MSSFEIGLSLKSLIFSKAPAVRLALFGKKLRRIFPHGGMRDRCEQERIQPPRAFASFRLQCVFCVP